MPPECYFSDLIHFSMTYRFILGIVCLGTVAVTHAQPPTPADIQRQKEHKAYQDAYMEGIRKADYRPKTYAGGVDAKAAQDLADLFAARAGRKTSAQKEAEEKAASQRYYEELRKNQAAFDKKVNFDVAVHKYYREPLKANYLAAGFDETEATKYAFEEVKTENGQLLLRANPAYFRGKSLLAELKRKEASAGFDELISLVLDLQATPAPVSSLGALQRMVQRFPDKLSLLHATMAQSFRTYFMDWDARPRNMRTGKKGSEKIVLWSKPTGTFKYMLESYEAYLAYDMPAALAAFKNAIRMENHPVVTLAFIAQDAKDKKRVGELCRMLLLSPNPDDKSKFSAADYQANAYRRVHEVSKHNYAYRLNEYYNSYADDVLSAYTAAEVKQIAAAQGIRPIDVVQAITSAHAFKRFAPGGKLYKEEKKAWKLDDLIKDLADLGDADAKAFLGK